MIQIISILQFWSTGLVTLIPFGQVLAAKDWKSDQIWLIQIISILQFWSTGLVASIPFGQVLAAKDWKSIQIWLIQDISILYFWSSDFGSFGAGFGYQGFQKCLNLAAGGLSFFLLFGGCWLALSLFFGYKQVALISFGKVVLEEFHTPFTCHVQLTFLLWHTSFWDVARFTYLVQFTA